MKNYSIESISKCVSVRNYTKYNFDIDSFVEDDKIKYPPHCPQHVKAAVNYNYLIAKYGLSLETVGDGSDIKLIYVNPNNELNTEVIGYIGKFPKQFRNIFKIDKEEQWKKQFESILQRFYDVVGWGRVNVDTTCASDFVKPITPALVAAYAVCPKFPQRPITEVMFIILP